MQLWPSGGQKKSLMAFNRGICIRLPMHKKDHILSSQVLCFLKSCSFVDQGISAWLLDTLDRTFVIHNSRGIDPSGPGCVVLVESQSTEVSCCSFEFWLKANTPWYTFILVPRLLTAFPVWKNLAASSSCCSQLTFLLFSCWLFSQLWKSVRPFSFAPHIQDCILLGRKPCWHSYWVCFIQLFSSPTCTKAVFISHLSLWYLYMPLLFWAVLAL